MRKLDVSKCTKLREMCGVNAYKATIKLPKGVNPNIREVNTWYYAFSYSYYGGFI